jgi:hypothetical protein
MNGSLSTLETRRVKDFQENAETAITLTEADSDAPAKTPK